MIANTHCNYETALGEESILRVLPIKIKPFILPSKFQLDGVFWRCMEIARMSLIFRHCLIMPSLESIDLALNRNITYVTFPHGRLLATVQRWEVTCEIFPYTARSLLPSESMESRDMPRYWNCDIEISQLISPEILSLKSALESIGLAPYWHITCHFWSAHAACHWAVRRSDAI